jgi:hypothetical protein
VTVDLENPEWFLYGIDPASGKLQFASTSEQIIRSASFLDGRETISATQEFHDVPLQDVLDRSLAEPDGPDRFLLHTAFCGSTFLAKLLDVPGKTLGYREPQVLVDLARMKVEKHPLVDDEHRWEGLLRFCLGQLRKHWGDSRTLVKPSNWANVILPDLSRVSAELRVATVTSSPQDCLVAHLRGGQDRIKYSLNLLNALISSGYVDEDDVQSAQASVPSGLEQVLRLLLVLHRAQADLLATISDASESVFRCDYRELKQQPLALAEECSQHLGLALAQSDIESAHAREGAVHSKDGREAYDEAREYSQSQELLSQFGTEISGALDWSASAGNA